MILWCEVCIHTYVNHVAFRAKLEAPTMTQEYSAFLLNSKNLRTTVYLSLVVAHLLFGMLYPGSIAVAALGFAFFTGLVLIQLRPAQTHVIKVDKTVNLDK